MLVTFYENDKFQDCTTTFTRRLLCSCLKIIRKIPVFSSPIFFRDAVEKCTVVAGMGRRGPLFPKRVATAVFESAL
jgi:hypothetical protein